MAVGHSFSPFIEYESPHGERFRMGLEKDACLDPVAFATTPIGSALSWAYAVPVVDGPQPFSGGFPPNAPTAATAAAELYAAATGFPLGAHQNNMGTCSYAMFGLAVLGTAHCGTIAACPAGIVVVNNVGAMTSGWPDGFHDYITGLRIIKTRGVVQALVDGTTDVAVSNLLEIANATRNLILDAANANEGTFVALEARTTNSVDMMWVELVGISH
jgi:hypothetical protein